MPESETEESENELYMKQKKAKCSAKENLQKPDVGNELPNTEKMGSSKTNRHSLECLPGFTQEEEWCFILEVGNQKGSKQGSGRARKVSQ